MMKRKQINVLVMVAMAALAVIAISWALAHSQSMLAAQFGLSHEVAQTVVSVAETIGTVVAVLTVVGGTAGFGASLLTAAKWAWGRYGHDAAANW
ncbi:hypothetical protein PUF88_05360 [Lactobacillaceae bacterium L1_55_11]|nr:hypothetical protein [Lactobacillaceae bacterium L1_55_11]